MSHVPLVKDARGHEYRPPVPTMRAYLQGIDKAASIAPPLDEPPPQRTGDRAFYLPLTNYRNNWKRLGFGDEDLEGGGSDRFLDAMVAWGSETAIRQRIQAHFDAGASHVCIQPLHPDGQSVPDYNALTVLAS